MRMLNAPVGKRCVRLLAVRTLPAITQLVVSPRGHCASGNSGAALSVGSCASGEHMRETLSGPHPARNNLVGHRVVIASFQIQGLLSSVAFSFFAKHERVLCAGPRCDAGPDSNHTLKVGGPNEHRRLDPTPTHRCRGNLEQRSQSRPDYGLDLSHLKCKSFENHLSCCLFARKWLGN